MPRQNMNLLCTYRYDPLDRLVACATSAQASTQRFYQRDRLATEIQGTVQHSIMQHDDQLLAQQERQNSAAAQTSLLATDQQRSVLTLLDAKRTHAFAYMPYGYCLAGNGLLSLLGFNGERPDPVTGWYLLGTGYHRPFNPVLMCFTSPDSWSPFGKGGVNAYAYCEGDPVNKNDSTGHFPNLFKLFTRQPSRGYSSLRSSKSSLLISDAPPPPLVREAQSNTESAGRLLKLESKETIKATKGRIPRNEAKLTRAQNELTNLEYAPELVIRQTLEDNPGHFGKAIQEALIRDEIPKRKEKLKIKINHYEAKLTALKSEKMASDIRKGR